MNTTQNNILVTDICSIVRTNKIISVELEGDEIYSFPRETFEEWVDEEGKREYFEVLPPGFDDEPIENSGTMPWEDYYECLYYREDLIQFINKFDLKPKP